MTVYRKIYLIGTFAVFGNLKKENIKFKTKITEFLDLAQFFFSFYLLIQTFSFCLLIQTITERSHCMSVKLKLWIFVLYLFTLKECLTSILLIWFNNGMTIYLSKWKRKPTYTANYFFHKIFVSMQRSKSFVCNHLHVNDAEIRQLNGRFILCIISEVHIIFLYLVYG